MPLALDPGDGAPISVDELAELLDEHPFDPRDEASLADAAPLLARLGRNPDFLGDAAIAALSDRMATQDRINSYGAQAFLLRPPGGRYILRANFWPAANDAIARASGGATFLYGLAHDHNFPFLSYGYLGPGYRSDYYERDPDAPGTRPGDAAHLRFVGRGQVKAGDLVLYRARRDVHRQLPPDAFSVTLNVLAYHPQHPWIDQFEFDVDSDRITAILNSTASEALVTLAAHFGGGEGVALATELAQRHPAGRMRLTAAEAIAATGPARAIAPLAMLADAPDRALARHARMLLDRAEADASAIIA